MLSYAVVNYGSGFLWRPTWRQTALIIRALALPLWLVARAAGQALRTAEST